MYKVVGISSGNGVILHPFLQSQKAKVILGVEGRREYLIKSLPLQWELNFGDIPFSLDLKIPREKVDIIVGHPKCGMSSVFALSRGKRNRSHKDDPSLNLYIEGISYFKPKYFLLENLPKLIDTFTSEQGVREAFPSYKLLYITGSVSQFGNSQISRKRLLIIGIRKDIFSLKAARLLANPYPINPLKTTGELLKGLPENGNITEPLDEEISVYGGFKQQLDELRRFWKAHPNLFRYPVFNGRMDYAPGVYINREDSYPKTVRKTNRQFNPKGIQMSPRELARIQGIPDSFKIFDDPSVPLKTRINKGRLTVANTPPYEIGEWFKRCMDEIFS